MMSMELDKILDEMESLILEASHLPFSEKIIIEEGDLSLVMDRLREAVPLETRKKLAQPNLTGPFGEIVANNYVADETKKEIKHKEPA